jgi:hypothetical protein
MRFKFKFWRSESHWVSVELNYREVLYISTLVFHDVKEDERNGLFTLSEQHAETMHKLRKALGQE